MLGTGLHPARRQPGKGAQPRVSVPVLRVGTGQGWGVQWVCTPSITLQASLRNYGGFGGRRWAASERCTFWSGVPAWAAPACNSSLYLEPTGETKGPGSVGRAAC